MLPLAMATAGFSLDGVNLMWIVMGGIAITAILCGAIKTVITSNSRERSRREIAAYIAEGSMTPEQGEKLMKAGEPQEE